MPGRLEEESRIAEAPRGEGPGRGASRRRAGSPRRHEEEVRVARGVGEDVWVAVAP